jgi:hypothetical protein
MTGDRADIESAITFLQQARQENLTAMHAIRGNLGPGAKEAFAANANAAAMWDAALRHLKTYLGGWHALPRFQRERESA